MTTKRIKAKAKKLFPGDKVKQNNYYYGIMRKRGMLKKRVEQPMSNW